MINTKKKSEWNRIHLPRVNIDDGKRDPTEVNLASAGAETKVLATFASGILPIIFAIYRRRSIIVLSYRCLPRVIPGR